MDVLVKNFDEYVLVSRVFETGKHYGFKEEDIREMLQFYNETGVILYFGGKSLAVKHTQKLVRSMVILKP